MSGGTSSTYPGRLSADGTDRQRVQALFVREVEAQEAMGLLAFHGFRTDGLSLQPAAGASWKPLTSRPRRHRPPLSWPRLAGGLLVGALTGAVVVAATYRLVSATAVVLVAMTTILGALVAAATRGPSSHDPTEDGPISPECGCVVTVRTLRAEEARLVLTRAGGLPVEPFEPSSPTGRNDDAVGGG